MQISASQPQRTTNPVAPPISNAFATPSASDANDQYFVAPGALYSHSAPMNSGDGQVYYSNGLQPAGPASCNSFRDLPASSANGVSFPGNVFGKASSNDLNFVYNDPYSPCDGQFGQMNAHSDYFGNCCLADNGMNGMTGGGFVNDMYTETNLGHDCGPANGQLNAQHAMNFLDDGQGVMSCTANPFAVDSFSNPSGHIEQSYYSQGIPRDYLGCSQINASSARTVRQRSRPPPTMRPPPVPANHTTNFNNNNNINIMNKLRGPNTNMSHNEMNHNSMTTTTTTHSQCDGSCSHSLHVAPLAELNRITNTNLYKNQQNNANCNVTTSFVSQPPTPQNVVYDGSPSTSLGARESSVTMTGTVLQLHCIIALHCIALYLPSNRYICLQIVVLLPQILSLLLNLLEFIHFVTVFVRVSHFVCAVYPHTVLFFATFCHCFAAVSALSPFAWLCTPSLSLFGTLRIQRCSCTMRFTLCIVDDDDDSLGSSAGDIQNFKISALARNMPRREPIATMTANRSSCDAKEREVIAPVPVPIPSQSIPNSYSCSFKESKKEGPPTVASVHQMALISAKAPKVPDRKPIPPLIPPMEAIPKGIKLEGMKVPQSMKAELPPDIKALSLKMPVGPIPDAPKKRFQCTMCNSHWFETEEALKLHINTHLIMQRTTKKRSDDPDRPWQCEVCNRKFAEKCTLKRHIRIHTNEKPWKCTFCTKAFNQSCSLQAHIRIHTGERPFPCDFCPKRFRQSTHRRQHCKRVHKQEVWYYMLYIHAPFPCHFTFHIQ